MRGKYDHLDTNAPLEPADANVAQRNIADTIKKELHPGEVNHFQALATAVSGTVGLGT